MDVVDEDELDVRHVTSDGGCSSENAPHDILSGMCLLHNISYSSVHSSPDPLVSQCTRAE